MVVAFPRPEAANDKRSAVLAEVVQRATESKHPPFELAVGPTHLDLSRCL